MYERARMTVQKMRCYAIYWSSPPRNFTGTVACVEEEKNPNRISDKSKKNVEKPGHY